MRLACRRHLDDLEHGQARGLWFDAAAAALAYEFFGLVCHGKGTWVGKPFALEPWQQWVVGCLIGWKRADGTRRFRSAHLEVARKNGKTAIAAVLALYFLLLDGEAGAEVYSVATKKDQAKLCHGEARRMVRSSPALRKYIALFRDALTVEASDSKFVPLGADSDTLDGLNVSTAICDELHAWKWRDLWDVVETATGARSQPIMISTTTAGSGRGGVWWERRDAAVKMLQGVAPNDELFAAIYTLDEGDDWTDERVWTKGNPNLGVTLQRDELRGRVREALASPGKQNAVKRLRLNVPTQLAVLAFDLGKWDRCAGPVSWEGLAGRECFGGLDLSQRTDLSALAWVFPPADAGEPWKALLRYWLPEADLVERCRRDRAPYDQWARDGFLELTDGETIDYDVVEARVLDDAKWFDVRCLAFDRYFANQLTTRLLDEGLTVEGYGQGYASMNGPWKELEGLIASGRFAHGGHPVLRFNAACTAVKTDPAGNQKPDKATSTGRIDGVVAVLMGLGKAITAETEVSDYRRAEE